MTENFQKHFGVILAFLAALFALLFFWTYQVYSLNAPTKWIEADRQFNENEDHAERLIALIGFQGLIHNFKDYLIRGDDEHKEKFFTYFEGARAQLKHVEALYGPAAAEQVAIIDEVLRAYFVNINKVEQLRAEGKSIREIDAVIQINDAPAFDALQQLIVMDDDEREVIRQLVLSAMEEDQSNLQSLYTTLFAIGLLLGVAVVMGLRFEYLKRQAVEQQSQTKSLLEGFLDYSTVPFLIAGADGKVRHCNLAAAALLETKPRNLVGAALSQILELKDVETGEDIPLMTRTAKTVSTLLELHNGAKIPVQADLTTNRDGTMRIVALFDQRSEIRMRQRILFEAEQKLAKVTIDGGRAIRRDVQSFIDLIQEFVDHVGEQPLDDEMRQEYIEAALVRSDALKEHIEDYLPLSGPLADSASVLELQDFTSEKLEKTVRDALRSFDRILKEKKLTFNWANTIPTDKVIDFPAQLERILSNLISNAVKYTKAGGAVKLSTSVKEGMLRLKVEDTGIGIAAKDIPRVFEPGFRVENAAEMSRGQGIGLYAVRESVRKLGGEIKCNSYAGIGSDFVVKIPLSDNEWERQMTPSANARAWS